MRTHSASVALLTVALCLAGSACSSDSEPATSDSTVSSSSAGDTQESTATLAPTTAAVESTQPSVPESASSAPPTTAPGSGGGATQGPIDALQAIDFAIANTPGEAVGIEATTEHDIAVWEIVVLQADGTTVEYLVSIGTGEILEIKPSNVAVASAPVVTLVEAIEIATSAVPDSVIVEARLDTESGQVVWDVRVRQLGSGVEVELFIDTETGEIIRQEVDD